MDPIILEGGGQIDGVAQLIVGDDAIGSESVFICLPDLLHSGMWNFTRSMSLPCMNQNCCCLAQVGAQPSAECHTVVQFVVAYCLALEQRSAMSEVGLNTVQWRKQGLSALAPNLSNACLKPSPSLKIVCTLAHSN